MLSLQSNRIIVSSGFHTSSKSSKQCLSLSLSLSQTSISMASHHHHHYQQQQQHSYPSCNGCCCSNNPSSFHPFPSPPPLPSHQSHLHTAVDPLIVQSIATQILQSSQNHLYTQQYLEKPPHKQHKQQNQQQTRSLLASLLRRIDALESSLHTLSVSPSPPSRPRSLRDLAARTIQIHFRAFLVRRSRTLRNLKDLAFIKSSFNNLKSSLSGNNAHLDPHALSQKAMDLLLKLDSVQGGDPMIRDGKRSISRELVRFLEFVDGISVKRQHISSKGMRNVRLAEDHNQESRVFINNTRDQSSRRVAAVDKISSNRRDLVRNFTVHLKKVSDQDDQEIQGFCRVSEDDDEEPQVEFDGFHPNNDEEEIPRNVNYRKGENSQAQNGISMKRQDLSLKPKKSVSFADNNGEVSRVFLSTQEPFSSEDGDSIDQLGVSGDDDQRELVEHLCREVEEIGGFSRVSEDDDEEEEEETQLEKRGLSQVSDGERNPREYVKTEMNHGLSRHFQSENGGFVFSPPMPVQMEPRKNNLRIVR